MTTRTAWAVLALLGCSEASDHAGGAGGSSGTDARSAPDEDDARAAAGGDGAAGGRRDAAGHDPDASDTAPSTDAAGSDLRDAAALPDAAPGGCLGGVVRVGALQVFAYEASRPDADAERAGTDTSQACSRPGVRPWTTVTAAEARAACAASGFRLCSDAAWVAACSGPRGWIFPYGEGHVPGRCNDHVSGIGELRPTGDFADCRTPEGVYDLSGNVWELTDDGSRRGASFRVNAATFRVDATRCDVYYSATELFADDDVGFRCCR